MTPPYQPQPQPPQPEPPKPQNWFQRNIGWKLAVLLAVAGIASCAAIINGPTAPHREAPPPVASDIEVDDSEASEPEAEAEASEPPTVDLGEPVRDDGYQFTVTNVKCGVSRVGTQYFGEKAQGQFCLVKLRVKNVSDDPIYFSDENQALVDSKGKTYSADDGAWIHVGDGELPFGEINPGNTRNTTVPFDVSKGAKPDYLLLKAGVWGFSEGVRVML